MTTGKLTFHYWELIFNLGANLVNIYRITLLPREKKEILTKYSDILRRFVATVFFPINVTYNMPNVCERKIKQR